MPMMSNTDVLGLMRSEEIQSVCKRGKKAIVRRGRKLNPLKNIRQLIKLNPYASVVKRAAIIDNKRRKADKIEAKSRRCRQGFKKARKLKIKEGKAKAWDSDRKALKLKTRNEKREGKRQAKLDKAAELAVRPRHHGLPWVRDQRKAVDAKITVQIPKKKAPAKKA